MGTGCSRLSPTGRGGDEDAGVAGDRVEDGVQRRRHVPFQAAAAAAAAVAAIRTQRVDLVHEDHARLPVPKRKRVKNRNF